jgi:hypothetical protein
VFLISGPRLHDESALVRLETALLQALRMDAPPVKAALPAPVAAA